MIPAEPSPLHRRLMRLWWAYVAFGVLSLAFCGYVVWSREPGWILRVGLQGTSAVFAIVMGLWFRRQRDELARRTSD